MTPQTRLARITRRRHKAWARWRGRDRSCIDPQNYIQARLKWAWLMGWDRAYHDTTLDVARTR